MIRSFIGISCPTDIQQSAQDVQHKFEKTVQNDTWRWVRPEALHLTLQFLGDISQDSIHDIYESALISLEGQQIFSLSVEGLGGFPHIAHPRVLWMGIKDQTQALQTVHEQLGQVLSRLRLPVDNAPFRPHLTLGRKKKKTKPGNIEPFLKTYRDYLFGTIEVKQIHLYESRQRQGGVTYMILKSIGL